ncbi:hypothetical protein CHUAL_010709 [Chamberlinius hualienensis]
MIRFTALILLLNFCLNSGWQGSVTAEGLSDSKVAEITTRDDFVENCKVLPGVNVTLSKLIGKWYLMSYIPLIPGLIIDKCDEMKIITNNTRTYLIYSFQWNIPFGNLWPNQPPYTSTLQPGPTPGTFMLRMSSLGITYKAYLTILAFDEKGVIIHFCWEYIPFFQNDVRFLSKEPNDAAFSELKSKAIYWDDNWRLELINQNNCSYAF